MTDTDDAAYLPLLLRYLERRYAAYLNAILASPQLHVSSDVDRWRGHAEAYRQTAEMVRRETGRPPVAMTSPEWREANGVYSESQLAEFQRIARGAVLPSGGTA